jgi:hypothetical protein
MPQSASSIRPIRARRRTEERLPELEVRFEGYRPVSRVDRGSRSPVELPARRSPLPRATHAPPSARAPVKRRRSRGTAARPRAVRRAIESCLVRPHAAPLDLADVLLREAVEPRAWPASGPRAMRSCRMRSRAQTAPTQLAGRVRPPQRSLNEFFRRKSEAFGRKVEAWPGVKRSGDPPKGYWSTTAVLAELRRGATGVGERRRCSSETRATCGPRRVSLRVAGETPRAQAPVGAARRRPPRATS